MNASPAPVVSRGSTANGGTCRTPSAPAQRGVGYLAQVERLAGGRVEAGIDAARSEVLNGGRSEQVIPDARHHGHTCPAQPRGDGLVGAFAPEAEMELAPENSLPGTGKAVGEGGQIDVRAPDHDDVRLVHGVTKFSILAFWAEACQGRPHRF